MRILIADDRDEVRLGLRVLLERQPGWEVIGQVKSVEELAAQIEALCPDLILVDWELPCRAGPGVASLLYTSRPDLVVIALSGRLESRQDALAAGVDAFVSKGDPPERLLAAIRGCCGTPTVLAGRH